MTTITLEAADVHVFVRVLMTLFGVPDRGDVAAHAETQELVRNLSQQVTTMTDNVNHKLEDLVAATTSLEQRVAAQDSKLTAAQQARDAAVAELQAAKDQLAAMPHDTTAQEQAIDAVISRLNAIDAEPVPAAPAPTPTPTDPNAPTGGELTPEAG